MLPLVDVARLAIAVPILVFAAVSDARTRRVPNVLWVPMLVAGGALLAIDWTSALEGWRYLVGALVAAIVALLLWRVGAFGGADAKALICLALLFPYPIHGDPISSGLGAPWLPAIVPILLLSLAIGGPISMAQLRKDKHAKTPYMVPLAAAVVLLGTKSFFT